MRMPLPITAMLVMLLGGSTFAHGQKQTELYIPIGQSPGISGKYAHIGKIEKTDPARRAITIAGASQNYAVTITERTRIWLDRSKLRMTTLTGGYTDLQVGRRVEVKYEDPDRKPLAEWIKVEISEPGAAPEAARKP